MSYYKTRYPKSVYHWEYISYTRNNQVRIKSNSREQKNGPSVYIKPKQQQQVGIKISQYNFWDIFFSTINLTEGLNSNQIYIL